jgi:hypothetical protein
VSYTLQHEKGLGQSWDCGFFGMCCPLYRCGLSSPPFPSSLTLLRSPDMGSCCGWYRYPLHHSLGLPSWLPQAWSNLDHRRGPYGCILSRTRLDARGAGFRTGQPRDRHHWLWFSCFRSREKHSTLSPSSASVLLKSFSKF